MIGIKEEEFEVQAPVCDVRFVDGRYEVDTPWKDNYDGTMGDNYQLAKTRLFSNIICYKKEDPGLLMEYGNIFKELLNEGTLEKVDDVMMKNAPVGKTYTMPHQLVVKRDKETTKVRAVYDCSSKMKDNVSLNDCVDAPEPLHADLFSVLIKFRVNEIALTGDIEKAFLQIGMAEKDSDAYRVLWVDDPYKDDPEIIMYRFTTVTFGVGPSMWHLGSVIQHHLQQYKERFPELVKKIEDALYADDFSGGDHDEKKTIALYKKTKKIFQEAGMNMRKWKSNSSTVMQEIKKNEKLVTSESESHAELMLNPNVAGTKVLGIPWDLEEDTLKVSYEKAVERAESGEDTKRKLISCTNTIYDPTGIAAPVTFFLKVLYQKLCLQKGSWDDKISEEITKIWKKWLLSAKNYPWFEYPRCYHPNLSKISEVMLIGFCDASESGYAAVVYLRCKDLDGKVTCSLVSSKTRVAPTKKQSIPRLELLGMFILAKLIVKIKKILEESISIQKQIRCFTDSAVALYWVQKNLKKCKKYIDVRAEKIRNLIPPDSWKHVPGKENVADLPSRGCMPEELEKKKETWLLGPDWLRRNGLLKMLRDWR